MIGIQILFQIKMRNNFRKIHQCLLLGFWRSPFLAAGFLVFFLVAFAVYVIRRSGEVVEEEDTSEFLARMEEEMSRRRSVVDSVCLLNKLGRYAKKSIILQSPRLRIYPPVPNYEAFYFDTKDKLTWCPVYKAASTSWLHNLCVLSGLPPNFMETAKEQISKVARKKFPSLEFEEGHKALEESAMKFFIVRHPFERLLSAYRDKLENRNMGHIHGTAFYYKKYGKHIVQKYRDPQKTKNISDLPESPNDLSKEVTHTNYFIEEERYVPPDGSEPTFVEFVRYLVDVNLLHYGDDHWMPYYIYCTPCFVEYNAIAKFETLEDDQKYIILKSKLEDRIEPQWKHKTKGTQSSTVVRDYFSTIPKELLQKLYEKYKLDFEMFEYSIDDYLKYVE